MDHRTAAPGSRSFRGATPELRREAVATFGALAALVVIRKLQAFEGYLLSEADQLV